MTHEPLSAEEQLKFSALIVICILISWALFYVGGFIPAVLLLYGFFMMKKNQDFEQVEVTARYAKLYFKILIFAGSIILAFFIGIYILGWLTQGTQFYEIILRDPIDRYFEIELDDVVYQSFFPLRMLGAVVLVPLIYFLPLVGCIAAIHHFYLLPLSSHREWVLVNGVYSKRPKASHWVLRISWGVLRPAILMRTIHRHC